MKMARLAVTAAYPALLILSSLSMAPSAVRVLLLAAPLTLLLNIWISQLPDTRWRRRLHSAVWLAAALLCVVLFNLRHENLQILILLQECLVLLVMAGVFGITLASGKDALCTRFVRLAHESPSPRLIRYSRQITLAWALFFVVAAVVSAVVYFLQPMPVWALYNSVGIPVCSCLFFFMENQAQKLFLPREERRTLYEIWKAIKAARTQQKSLLQA